MYRKVHQAERMRDGLSVTALGVRGQPIEQWEDYWKMRLPMWSEARQVGLYRLLKAFGF